MQSRGKTPSCCCFVAPTDKAGSLSQLCTFSRQSHGVRWNWKRYRERRRKREAPTESKDADRKIKCSTDRLLETKKVLEWVSHAHCTPAEVTQLNNGFAPHRVFRPPTQQGPTSRRESLCSPLSSTTNTSWSRSCTLWNSRRTSLCATGKAIILKQNNSNVYNPE